MFMNFLKDQVDSTIPASDLKQRLLIISDMINAIVGASFEIIERFESYMKEKDGEFPMNFFAEIFIQLLINEMGNRGLAYGIEVPKEEFKKTFLKNFSSVDPTKLN